MVDVIEHWYRRRLSIFAMLLLPFSYLFQLIVCCRFLLYKIGILRSYAASVPVVVVGNVTVGGTGKTPFVIWFAQWLKERGYKPGIVSRGYGGKRRNQEPVQVQLDADPAVVGDEALILRQHTGCPVVVSVDRVQAVNALLQHTDCDIVISDDGLQHYRLRRNFEIAIIDGMRRLGNMRLLPAGPLREPPRRLRRANWIVVNGSRGGDAMTMELIPEYVVSICAGVTCRLFQFMDQPVHAVAGVGHPERFFRMLKQLGLQIIPHAFQDHYRFRKQDIDFQDNLPVIMTEKDAVKCRAFVDTRHWYLTLRAEMSAELKQSLSRQFARVTESVV
jgi:tetraacyldisaccharide 4'-kinase